jgi:hypothetical protein
MTNRGVESPEEYQTIAELERLQRSRGLLHKKTIASLLRVMWPVAGVLIVVFQQPQKNEANE